jgi:TPR repeat protein
MLLSLATASLSLADSNAVKAVKPDRSVDKSTLLNFEQVYEQAWNHLTRPVGRADYHLALKFMVVAARQGHRNAQANLGAMYEMGLGISRDYQLALEWYRRAAQAGSADAQYNLANLYYHGLGVSLSNKLAVHWFQKAAEQQHAKSELMLAAAYFFGRGISRDMRQAWRWAELASAHGLAEASHALGLGYKHGIGVDKSTESAANKFYLAGDVYLRGLNRIKALEMLNLIREISPSHPLYLKLKRTLYVNAAQGARH